PAVARHEQRAASLPEQPEPVGGERDPVGVPVARHPVTRPAADVDADEQLPRPPPVARRVDLLVDVPRARNARADRPALPPGRRRGDELGAPALLRPWHSGPRRAAPVRAVPAPVDAAALELRVRDAVDQPQVRNRLPGAKNDAVGPPAVRGQRDRSAGTTRLAPDETRREHAAANVPE